MARRKKEKEVNITPRITRKELKRQRVLLIWAAVFVVYGFVFCYLPLGGWLMAFQNYKPKTGILHSKYVGFDKFKVLFSDPQFFRVFRNTLAMGTLNLVTTFIMAILFAILLNEIRGNLMKKTVQTISYLPHFLSWIIVTGILHDAMSSSGTINEILLNLHVVDTYIPFFSIEKYFWPIVAFANCWKETGWNAIVYLAAITSIDPSLYEAASIDGAGRFHKIMNVTLPGIRSTFVILLIMNIGHLMEAGFEIQYLLGSSVVMDWSQTIDVFVLQYGISKQQYGVATAAGMFKSIVAIILLVSANAISRRLGEDTLI